MRSSNLPRRNTCSEDFDPGLVPPGTAVVDLDGVVIPGLIDTHPHLLHFALAEAACVRLFDAVDHADVVSRLAASSLRPWCCRYLHRAG